MSQDEFELRPGRIGSRGAGGARTFVGEALAAAQRAGGLHRRTSSAKGAFGRGRAASLAAEHALGPRSRGAVVKARVVRNRAGQAPLALHLDYLQREGVTKESERGQLFDADGDAADGRAFADRCVGDRHHFRFIVSPDDAERLADLKAFTRDLMAQAQVDLATRLDWVGVDHWNTGHPHVHVLVRGRADDGADLVISRDYIGQGLRARAGELVTLELGPRPDLERRQALEAQVSAERWTGLDRSLARLAQGPDRLIDLRPPARGRPDALDSLRIARLRKLAGLGLAREARPGRWRIAPEAEATLQALGRRGDIIARLHRAMSGQGVARDPARFVIEPGEAREGLTGRLVARGLDDELAGSAYAVVDGVDGRTHHVALPDLADASDAPVGAVVEVRRQQGSQARARIVLEVRSDLSLADQIKADGLTWLDRQLVGRAPAALGEGGFAEDVRAALAGRADHLAGAGLARRQGRRLVFARDLLATLRTRELAAAAARLAGESGLAHQPLTEGGEVVGTYRRRLDLASGRFAMIDDGLGFSLAPWRPELERHLGRTVEGLAGPGQAIAWRLGRSRDLGV